MFSELARSKPSLLRLTAFDQTLPGRVGKLVFRRELVLFVSVRDVVGG